MTERFFGVKNVIKSCPATVQKNVIKCATAEGECTNCECNGREEDQSFENDGGLSNRRHRRMRIMSIIKKLILILSLLAFTSCVAVGT